MKLILFCLCALALPVSLSATEQIKVETKFLEVDGPIPHDFSKLNQMAGVDLLSAPSVTTKSGQRAAVQIAESGAPASINADGYPPVETGNILDVTPEIKEGHLTYNAHVTLRHLVGFKDEGGQKISEYTSRELYFSGTPKDGEWIWIDLLNPTGKKRLVVCVCFTRQNA